MNPLPDCPRCDAANTLEVFRTNERGEKWAMCSCCSSLVLLDTENLIQHVSVYRRREAH